MGFFSEAALTTLTAVVTEPAQGTNSWTLDADESLYKEQQFVYNNVLFTIETVSADPVDSDFEYATQCSNRGTCDYGTGTCTCFSGYSNDNCDTQNAYSN